MLTHEFQYYFNEQANEKKDEYEPSRSAQRKLSFTKPPTVEELVDGFKEFLAVCGYHERINVDKVPHGNSTAALYN